MRPVVSLALLSLLVVASTCVALAPAAGTAKTTGDVAPPAAAPEGPGVLLAWEEHAFAAIYPTYPSPLAPSIPGGVPVLGFTSLTMYDAVRASERRTDSSEAAAVATRGPRRPRALRPAAARQSRRP